MPSLTQPPSMPGEVTAAIENIGNRARAQIIHELALHSPQSARELADRVGAHPGVVYQHLLQLESAHLVAADTEAGRRAGKIVRWTVNADAVDTMIRTLTKYLLPER